MNDNLREQLLVLPAYFQGHLVLTLIAMTTSILVSIPLGIWAARSARVKRPLLVLISIIQTFPSIAILALVVALLGGRIGLVPAITALVLYSMLPIVRNTVTGLETVSAEVVEAARGIGMSPGQILLRVRLPLAMPFIIAGIRTAAVWTVGLATLSTLVGATSFGNYIFTGLQTRNLVAVTVGSLAAATMAVLLDGLIGAIQWLAEHRNERSNAGYRRISLAVLAGTGLGVAVVAYALMPEEKVDFVVGGKGFTEQYIIAGLVAAELQKAGFTVEQRVGMGSEVVYEATANSSVDVYLEYSGTVWANIMGRDDNPGRWQVLEEVTAFIAEKDAIGTAATLGFQNLYALAMRRDRAVELGVTAIDDLLPVSDDLVAGGDLEFFGRPEWLKLRDTYAIDFAEKLTFDTSLLYSAINERQVDLISAYTTDGRVAAYNLVLLDDPLSALPPYDAFLAASERAMSQPLFVEIMNRLNGKISDQVMREANRIVDVEGGSVSEAVAYLQGMIWD
ncbi:MAG: ABC transporter permease/substrate-binding protein [Gammaproteobacteria bacterium]|nr:ABC transporter permease/substrate-binding protein [Gammaproteobacteria bacterium]MCY4358461.1 ABC transporter permease/substrate-binding protein [Gammaproteobacteria bacterium]